MSTVAYHIAFSEGGQVAVSDVRAKRMNRCDCDFLARKMTSYDRCQACSTKGENDTAVLTTEAVKQAAEVESKYTKFSEDCFRVGGRVGGQNLEWRFALFLLPEIVVNTKHEVTQYVLFPTFSGLCDFCDRNNAVLTYEGFRAEDSEKFTQCSFCLVCAADAFYSKKCKTMVDMHHGSGFIAGNCDNIDQQTAKNRAWRYGTFAGDAHRKRGTFSREQKDYMRRMGVPFRDESEVTHRASPKNVQRAPAKKVFPALPPKKVITQRKNQVDTLKIPVDTLLGNFWAFYSIADTDPVFMTNFRKMMVSYMQTADREEAEDVLSIISSQSIEVSDDSLLQELMSM